MTTRKVFIDITENNDISHHGIKGQKWGKRNGPPYPLSDAKARAVVRQVKKTKNKLDKVKYVNTEKYKQIQSTMPLVQQIKESTKYKAARDAYDTHIRDHMDKYNKNIDLYKKLAARAAYEDYGKDAGKSFEDILKGYTKGDLDQGSYTSFDFYLLVNGHSFDKFIDSSYKARKKMEACGKEAINLILGKNKDLVIQNTPHRRRTVESVILDALRDYDVIPFVELNYSEKELQQMKRIVKMYMK